jgi:proton glutamate symport protein
MKDGTRVLIGLGAGLAGGIAIAASHNDALVRAADLIAPIGTLWVNAIRMTVIPLVVSLLITGVASAADIATIGRIGAKSLLVFVSLLIGMALVAVPVAVGVFSWLPRLITTRPPLPAGAAEAASSLAGSGQAANFASWLTSLIPTNPVAAAANGAMLSLVLFTLFLSLAIARSPAAARDTLVGFFRALSDAMLVLVGWVVALAPIGVFALLLPLGAHGGAGLAGAVGFYIAAYSILHIVFVLLLYPVAVVIGRVPLRQFARAALAPQLIAFSSSSSIAALPALVEAAEDGLSLPTRITGFVLPLAVSMFKQAAPVSWTAGALFVAWYYHVDLHVTQLMTVSLAAVFLAFAVPGVPRGAFLLLTPLFLAIGLPAEGIGILIAVDAIPDLFATVLNTTGNLVATILVARGSAAS